MTTLITVIVIGLFVFLFSILSIWFENTKLGEWLEKAWQRNQVTIGMFGFLIVIVGFFQEANSKNYYIGIGGFLFVLSLLNLLSEIAYNTRDRNDHQN